MAQSNRIALSYLLLLGCERVAESKWCVMYCKRSVSDGEWLGYLCIGDCNYWHWIKSTRLRYRACLKVDDKQHIGDPIAAIL
eukprot:4548984-Ditylum_brightwellii.AAC.1